MCKRIQNNFLCDHYTIADMGSESLCTLDFTGAHAMTWEQVSVPYPCELCIHRFDNAATMVSQYVAGLNAAFTPILHDLVLCEAMHASVPGGLYSRNEVRVISRAFARCIDKLFAAEQVAEGFHELHRLRADVISDLERGVEGEESWQASSTLQGLDAAIEARLEQTTDWNFHFGGVVRRFVSPFRFLKLVNRAAERAPEGVMKRYTQLDVDLNSKDGDFK